MPVPDFQSLMLPTLRGVAERSISSADLRGRIAASIGLSEGDLQELLPSGRQTTFANRVAWANVFLQRAGLIRVIRRGVYEITSDGKTVLAENPSRIDMKYLERFPAYTEWRARSGPDAQAESQTLAGGNGLNARAVENPEEQMERSHRILTATVEVDLLDRLRQVAPSQFERIIVQLLLAMGYGGGQKEMGEAVGRSGDNGIDGVIREDKLGLDVVYMQAKRYAATVTVGESEVRDFVGSLEGQRADKGVFVTTSTFTSGARSFVGRVSKRVILIDGPRLASLMVTHGVGVRTRAQYEVKSVDDDFFLE